MTTVLLTVTRSPSKAGIRVLRSVEAMQPPVGVPAKGGPLILALVTRPEGANVTTTLATPDGSPSLRQAEACPALAVSGCVAAGLSKGPAGSAGGVGSAAASGFGSSGATAGAAGSALGSAALAGWFATAAAAGGDAGATP